MNRYNSDENSLDGNNNYSKSETICMRLRVLMYCLFVLVGIRIATFELLWMITDILSCVIVYCTSACVCVLYSSLYRCTVQQSMCVCVCVTLYYKDRSPLGKIN